MKNPSADNAIGLPFVVAIRNPQARIWIGNARLSADDPIDWSMGIDYYRDSNVDAVPINIRNDLFQGLWQGVLLENPGPAEVAYNTFAGLASTTSGGTVYGGEGIVDLAYGLVPDYWPSRPVVRDQKIRYNSFGAYNGYGAVMEAGYWGGLTGQFTGTNRLSRNTFNMLAPDGVAAIGLFTKPGSTIGNLNVAYNTGTIQSPGIPIWRTFDGTFTNTKRYPTASRFRTQRSIHASVMADRP